jgi:signal transduction histidine kinase
LRSSCLTDAGEIWGTRRKASGDAASEASWGAAAYGGVDEVVRNGDSVPRDSAGARNAQDAGPGRRFPIRFKLAAALAVPMAALLFVASTKVFQTRADAQEARDQADLALSVAGPRSLVRSLTVERNHTSAHLTHSEAMVNIEEGDYLDARPATDEALADFQQVVRDAGGKIEEAYQPAIDAMDGLAELRQTVDDYRGPLDFNNLDVMQEVFDGYSDLVNQLFDANRQVSLAVNDLELRRGASLVNLANRNSDTVARLTRTLVVASLGGDGDGINTSDEITRVAELLNQLRRNEVSIRENGVGVYRPYVEALFASDHTQRFPAAVQTALDTTVVDITQLLGNAGDRDAFGYDDLLDRSRDELASEAAELTSDAEWTRNLYTIFGLAVVLLGAVMTWLVSRSITRPLRSLTRQATAMANQHLPGAVLDILETPLGENVTVPNIAPIEIHTRDEVADVAAALNTVQESALDLAVEQAVLRRNIADSFVNLGRRNQNLLSRQLDFITELERNEADPDALASLFRLDHLATRMRRNAESLLVLAGIDPPRKWAAPVRLNDVIRAALSEIEDYQRVTVVAVESATVTGSAAAGLAHLLAELIENAVTFSAPDQTVEVRGRSLSEGGYMLAVIDQGLGMSADEIEAANRRLAGDESFTIAPSKYLGHYVTGNLASRHGITVRLQSSVVSGLVGGGGITATIALPPDLLTAEPTAGNAGALTAPAPALRGAPAQALALQGAAVGAGADGGPAAPAVTIPAGSVDTLAPPPPTGRASAFDALASLPTFDGRRRTPPPASPSDGPAALQTFGRPPSQPPSSFATPARGTPTVGPAPSQPPSSFATPARGTPPVGRAPSPDATAPYGTPIRPGDDGPAPAAFDVPPGGSPFDAPASPAGGPWGGVGFDAPQDEPRFGAPAPSAAFDPPNDPPSLGRNGGQTTRGLARRIRGANLPTTRTMSLRRTEEEAAGPSRPAEDVYSFLSNFQAGVQRGLDDARGGDGDGGDET